MSCADLEGTLSKVNESFIYRGRILDLVNETHQQPDGREVVFEIVQHPGGSAALPILDDGRLLLIRQFRPAAAGYIYEIPAGRLEEGECPVESMRRELREEVGMLAAELMPLGFVYSSVGYCTEKIHLFIARGLTQVTASPEPDEFIEPEIVTLKQALEMIAVGTIVDSKTQLAILRYAMLNGEG
jgi:ADP-ribose pyrophosphatase